MGNYEQNQATLGKNLAKQGEFRQLCTKN